MEQLSENENAVNTAVNKMPWCDAWVVPGAFNTLVLALSTDLDYYHTIEVVFHEVLFSRLKHTFKINVSKGLFQVVNEPELSSLHRENLVEVGYQLYRLMDEDKNLYYIVADRISASFDTVYHYYNEELQLGERIASWIEKQYVKNNFLVST